MATIAAAQTGYFGTTTTWTGAVVPGSGDTVTVGSGIVIFVEDTRAITASTGSGTYKLLANGKLTVGSVPAILHGSHNERIAGSTFNPTGA